MKKRLSIAAAICFAFSAGAQTASAVLENGIHLRSKNKVFFKYENNVLKYDDARSIQRTDLITLPDSSIFLVERSGVNVYIRPLNPLNYSYASENKIIIDPIDEAAATALGTIIDDIKNVIPSSMPMAMSKAMALNNSDGNAATLEPCDDYVFITDSIKNIESRLADNKKDEINEQFKTLKALDFEKQAPTEKALEQIEKKITAINDYFIETENRINETGKLVKTYSCSYPDAYMARYVFNSVLKDFLTTLSNQKKRLTNLKAAYDLADKVAKAAASGDGDNLSWCIKLDEIPVQSGKISIYTVTIKESGYKLSDDNEIVSIESKEILKRTVRIRRFQRFVPEVSAGTAFTFFKYNTYGTTSDSTGRQYVASPAENAIRNLNITTMLNFNYYIPNSSVHPFYQLGAGINSGIPTILTGFGFRSNINGLRRLAISGGIAITWIKELDKLKVGDKVSGTDDIEKDLKYQFVWPPKPYVGLQYNF